jgi:indole-3-glycerol phosphate synthase
MGVLENIISNKRSELRELKACSHIATMGEKARALGQCRDLAAALRQGEKPAIIAEIKKASPSKGSIRKLTDIGQLALSYQKAGAAALSVLTDSRFFGGSMQDLHEARRAVNIPILRKDFIIDPVQIHEAKLGGADAILLIVAALNTEELHELYKEALNLGMGALVEVHNETELERAMALGPKLVGINNRDLKTMEIDLDTGVRLRRLIPDSVVTVSESGINSGDDMDYLMAHGLDAFLVGTALMMAPDPGMRLRECLNSGVKRDPCEDMRANIP